MMETRTVLIPCLLCSGEGMIPDRRIPRNIGGMICPRCAGSRVVKTLYVTPYPFMEGWPVRRSEAA